MSDKCPRSLNLPKQCRLSLSLSLSLRDAFLEVQCPLRNEKGGNLEQSKKDTTSAFFPCMLKSGQPV